MKKTSMIMGGIIVLAIFVVIAAGIYKFNFTNDDIYVVTESGEVVKYDDMPAFDFPEELDTKYISGSEWPPTITMSELPLVCDEGEMKVIYDREYCVTEIHEGAAGSEYITYTYSTEHNEEVMNLSFTLRSVNCDNYDEPQRAECKEERESFDIGLLVHETIE